MAGPKIRGGPGVRVSRYGSSHIFSAPQKAWRWDPAFPVSYGGNFVQVGFGLVNDVEPTVKGVPVSGDLKTGQQPKIEILDYDAEGRAWVCLQVKVDLTTGKLAKEGDSVTVVVKSSAGTQRVGGESAEVGLHVLAVVTKDGRVHQVTFFNLSHAIGYPTVDNLGNKSKVPRHFFW
jgi:hypothetical protein